MIGKCPYNEEILYCKREGCEGCIVYERWKHLQKVLQGTGRETEKEV